MRNIVILLVVAATAINLIYWLSRSPDAANTPTSVEPTTSSGAAETPPVPASRTVEILDIPLQISASGNLIPDTRLKQLFDLIASENTEQPVDQWKHTILQQFSEDLPPAALAQLQDAFDRYVEFNLALQLLPMEGAPNLQAVLQRVQNLREHYLGDIAAPMYEDWRALEDFTYQYLNIMAQQRDPAAAQSQLNTLADQLPPAVQQRAHKMVNATADDFAADSITGLDPESFQRMLQEMAAVSLIETTLMFDEPSPEFMAKYEQYGEQKRDVLLSDLSDAAQQEKLSQLRAQYFSGSEILRVETLDRAEAF